MALSRCGDGRVFTSHCGVGDEPTNDATTGVWRSDHGLVPSRLSQGHDPPL